MVFHRLHRAFGLTPIFVAVLALTACGGDSGTNSTVSSVPEPVAPSNQMRVTSAQMNDNDMSNILFRLKAGDTLILPAGKFKFDRPLIMNTDGVTITGQGSGIDPSKDTILTFKNASSRNGIQVSNVKTVTLKNFAVEDAVGNAVFVNQSSNVTIDGVRAEWTVDPTNTSQMAYGLYPVNCDNVIVKNSKVVGSEDAGIYVGQSKDIRVFDNEVYLNVAGVEIENSVNAIVERNHLYNNTGGILVFSLPGTYRFKKNMNVLIQDNNIHDNNMPVAKNSTGFVASVPPGTGIMVLAADNTEVKNNTIRNHNTTSLLAISFQTTGFKFDEDPAYDPFIHGFYAHDNKISGSGAAPGGAFKTELKPVVDGLFQQFAAAGLPQLFPYSVWDGILDPAKSTGLIPIPNSGGSGVGGTAAAASAICVKNNTADTPVIAGVMSYETIDLNLIGLQLGQAVAEGKIPPAAIAGIPEAYLQPSFPFPPRMNCELSLPAIPAFPTIN